MPRTGSQWVSHPGSPNEIDDWGKSQLRLICTVPSSMKASGFKRTKQLSVLENPHGHFSKPAPSYNVQPWIILGMQRVSTVIEPYSVDSFRFDITRTL